METSLFGAEVINLIAADCLLYFLFFVPLCDEHDI